MSSYPDSVQYLYRIGNEHKSLKFGLDRIRALLQELGNPQDGFSSVHVAGTNGKGSTCALIEAALRQAGQRTGLYTSPHLVEPTERIQIAGTPVTQERFAEAFATVHHCAEGMLSQGRLDAHPTYFETVTAMAFWLFREEGVETAVLETGLGGRLDATNVITPRLSVITPIDLDHQSYLGNTLEAIAAEKGGIIKSLVPVVCARQHHSVYAVLRARAAYCQSRILSTQEWRLEALQLTPDGCSFHAVGPEEASLAVECSLAGEHQVGNALTAAVALHTLGVPVDGMAQAHWPGRLERIAQNPDVLLDGAHNPAGVQALVKHLQRFYRDHRKVLLFGAMRDKSVQEMLALLTPAVGAIVLTQPDNTRAMSPTELAAFCGEMQPVLTATAIEGLAWARDMAASDGLVIVAGSLFLVGDVRKLHLGTPSA